MARGIKASELNPDIVIVYQIDSNYGYYHHFAWKLMVARGAGADNTGGVQEQFLERYLVTSVPVLLRNPGNPAKL